LGVLGFGLCNREPVARNGQSDSVVHAGDFGPRDLNPLAPSRPAPTSQTTVTGAEVAGPDDLARHFSSGPIPDRVTLPNVHFEFASTDLVPEGADATMDRVVAWMRSQPAARVRIEGYTDNAGTNTVDGHLSLARAEKLKDLLVERGVDATRIETRGRTDTNPAPPNDTSQGRYENRRADLVILAR
jgi:outer membrane protein OmpA-like peptidoglycan-associated protein